MISVIIPTLNEEKLLPSLLLQFSAELRSRYDLELIVSDGGSSDDTLSIAEAAGVLVLRHDGSRRQTFAEGRNLGAAAAKGATLVFINGDIRFADIDRFFVSVKQALASNSIAGATCEVQVFPEEERFIDIAFHNVHNAYIRLLNLIGEGMGRGECQILSKQMFHNVGGYNPSMVAGEDFDLFRRVRKHGKIEFLRDVTIYESPRRFRKYGYTHIVWGWTRNALSVIFKNRSSSEEWEAVR